MAPRSPPVRRSRAAMLATLSVGAGLCLALFWRNDPFNAFDNHFTPILEILQTGSLPDKLACFECSHPPVFYVLSAGIAKALVAVGVAGDPARKVLQFVSCASALATLWFVLLVLERLPLPAFARWIALAFACFLPRHVFMAAIHSNDALSYLAATVCVYLLLRVVDGDRSWPWLAALSAAVTAAIFTKLTALVVVPAVALTLPLLALPPFGVPRRKVVAMTAAVLLVPGALFAADVANNLARYGEAIPNPGRSYRTPLPRDRETPDFSSFEPWRFVRDPLIRPGQASSFFTILNASMWFDVEAKLQPAVSGDVDWWRGYTAWLRRKGPFPGGRDETLRTTTLIGGALEALGIVWLALGLAGAARAVALLVRAPRDGWGDAARFVPALVLVAFSVAGVVHMTLEMPALSFAEFKATFMLAALSGQAALVGLGTAWLQRWRWARYAMAGTACATAVLLASFVAIFVRNAAF